MHAGLETGFFPDAVHKLRPFGWRDFSLAHRVNDIRFLVDFELDSPVFPLETAATQSRSIALVPAILLLLLRWQTQPLPCGFHVPNDMNSDFISGPPLIHSGNPKAATLYNGANLF